MLPFGCQDRKGVGAREITMSAIAKSSQVDVILAKARDGADLSPAEGVILLEQTDPEAIAAIGATADEVRQHQVGETVTYVVNRNLNFTNICEQHCSFCAFRRDAHRDGAYWLDFEQILAKAADAVARHATEICLQGGLNPQTRRHGSALAYYVDLIQTLHNAYPQLHLHAFSPQEVQFIARQDDLSYAEVIESLQTAGVSSLPGTAAEVLDDTVRRIICPEKLDTATWLEIVATAHRLGVPTTSTMLCGHIETAQQQIAHLDKLRSLQKRAKEQNAPGCISEFILLPFVGEQAPLPLRRRVGRDQPDLEATLHLSAVARLYLGQWIANHQPSWVKLGLPGAIAALNWGCNDIGGTLMEEHITTMAGAKGGTCMAVETLQEAISSIGRPYCERTTLYELKTPVAPLVGKSKEMANPTSR